MNVRKIVAARDLMEGDLIMLPYPVVARVWSVQGFDLWEGHSSNPGVNTLRIAVSSFDPVDSGSHTNTNAYNIIRFTHEAVEVIREWEDAGGDHEDPNPIPDPAHEPSLQELGCGGTDVDEDERGM